MGFVGGLEFIIGGILFTSLFRYFVRVFSALKVQNGQSLSYCDSVALSCKVVSAIFACVSCATGIIVLRDCGCISFSVYNAIPRHYMSFGLSTFSMTFMQCMSSLKRTNLKKLKAHSGCLK